MLLAVALGALVHASNGLKIISHFLPSRRVLLFRRNAACVCFVVISFDSTFGLLPAIIFGSTLGFRSTISFDATVGLNAAISFESAFCLRPAIMIVVVD